MDAAGTHERGEALAAFQHKYPEMYETEGFPVKACFPAFSFFIQTRFCASWADLRGPRGSEWGWGAAGVGAGAAKPHSLIGFRPFLMIPSSCWFFKDLIRENLGVFVFVPPPGRWSRASWKEPHESEPKGGRLLSRPSGFSFDSVNLKLTDEEIKKDLLGF